MYTQLVRFPSHRQAHSESGTQKSMIKTDSFANTRFVQRQADREKENDKFMTRDSNQGSRFWWRLAWREKSLTGVLSVSLICRPTFIIINFVDITRWRHKSVSIGDHIRKYHFDIDEVWWTFLRVLLSLFRVKNLKNIESCLNISFVGFYWQYLEYFVRPKKFGAVEETVINIWM